MRIKPTSIFRLVLQHPLVKSAVALLMCVSLLVQPAAGASFYWDTDATTTLNNVNGTDLGGTGNWDLATSNWWDTSALTLWPNTTSDIGIFSGPVVLGTPTANTVTLSSGITANQVRFERSGYTLTGGDLTLSGTTPTLHANLGESATISSQLLGTAGLTMRGGGSIRLTSVLNSYTGTTTIANGSLIISNAAVLGGAGTVTITANNNTPLNTAMIGFGGGSLVLDGAVAGFTFARNVDFEGRGPIGDRGAAILSLGNNTLSGTLRSAISPLALSPTATIRNSRINSVNGTLTLSGTLDVGGTAGTTITNLGGVNAAGIGDYLLTGVLTGTGTLEKSGAGTLFLNASNTSGFSGRLRVSSSATGQQSSVRVASLNDGANTTSIFGTSNGTTTSAPIDMNGGVLEITSDTSLNFGKNVYQRASSTIYVGPAAGGVGLNGTATFASMAFEDNLTNTFNSRNGFGVSFTTAPVVGTTAGDNNSTITNNMGGTLSFTGNFWSNANNTDNRTMTIGGNGNTIINGNVIASAAAFNHNLSKTGSGLLTITGNAATLDGTVSVQGSMAITDFRSIGAATNAETITLGNATTTAGNLIIGTSTAPTAGNLATSRPIVLNGTTVSNSIYANQSGATGVTLNGAITKPAATTGSLILGGTSTADNTLASAIPLVGTGGLVKVGGGTWSLSGTNLYTGATSVSNGTLKLKANAAVSTIIDNASGLTFAQTNQYAGGVLELVGQTAVSNVETMGALTPTDGANTIKLTPGASGGTASLIFGSVGTIGDGATVNISGSNGTTNTVTLTGQAGLNASPRLFFGGANFAFAGAGGVMRAPLYGTDADFAAATSSALTATQSNSINGSFATNSITIDTLKIDGAHTLTLNAAQTLTVRTGAANTDGAILATGGASTITGGTGISTGGSGSLTFYVNGLTDTLTIDTVLTAGTTGGLTKSGAGTLILTKDNLQTGTITLNEGTIQLSGAGDLGAGAALTMRQGTTLNLNGISPVSNINAFNSNGTVTSGTAATFTVGGSNGTGTSLGTVTGAISLTKIGTGAQSWLGSSSYTGVTTIGSTGLVTVDTLANGGLPSGIGASTSVAANLIFNGSTGGLVYQGNTVNGNITTGSASAITDRLFTLSGTGATLSSTATNNNAIVWSNTGAIVHGVVGPQALILTGTSTGDNTFNPQLTDSGTVANITSLNKTGAGQWNLGNTSNTYTGITTLNEGILALNNNGALPTNSPLLLAPSSATSVAVFQMSGTFARSLAASATAGIGTVTFGGTTASTTGGVGFAAHTTPLTVAIGGVLSPTALTWGSGGFVGTGAVQNLVLNSTSALSSVEFRNAIDLGTLARTINVLDNGNTGADYATMSGILSGSGGGIVKIGSGVLRLTGANTYTGVTQVQAGTLVVQSLGSSSGGGSSSVGAGGVTMDNANAIQLGAGGNNAGLLQYVGPGETSDRKIRFNSTTGSSSTNQIHADGSGPLILTNVANDMTAGAKTVVLRGSNNAGNMITSPLADNGGALSVTVDGGATWILTGTNTFTGNLTAGAGALGIGDAAAVGAGTLVNGNGNIFAYGADRAITNALTLSNNTTNGWLGDYSLTFSSVVNMGASANNITTNNNIVAGKTLTFNNGVTANALGANRAWVIDGAGETVINGDFTTSTAFGVRFDVNGGGTLTLGTNGATSNFNQSITAVDVDRGILKFTTNNAIPSASAAYGGITLSPELATSDTATLNLNGTSQTINALSANTDGTTIIDNTAATAASLTFGANDSTVTFGTGTGAYTITDSGAGALSIFKAGNTSTTIPAGVTLTYQGTTGVTGGSMTIASPVDGTSGLSVTNSGSTLTLSGGITNANAVTSIVVENGGTLNLTDAAGSQFANLANLTLGSSGGSMTTLGLNVGDLNTAGDELNTDLLSLISAGTLNLFTGNKVTLNLTDAGLNPSETYDLLTFTPGGFTSGPLTSGDWLLGATPGGFSSITLTVNNDRIFITTGTLITGDSYWNGTSSTTWNVGATNWSQDKAGLTAALSIPGQGTDVIFQSDAATSGAVVTTLEQNFKINSLTFEAATIPANTPTSIAINPGVVATNRLEIAPQVATDGIAISAGGTPSVTISAPLKLGSNQTWNIADAASTLTLSGGLQGEKDVTIAGSGKVILSAAADSTFNTGLTSDFTINGGNLEITNNGALGTTANSNLANVIVNSTGGFYYNNATAGTVANPITLAGGTLSGGGANHTYSGTVNVSADSLINMRNNNGGIAETQERNITLSGVVSGSGNLTVFSDLTLSSGNALSGNLTLSNAANTWSGDLLLNQGTVTFGALASPSVTANDIIFSSLGKVAFQGVNAATLTRTGTLNYAAGSIGEFNVDNTSGSLGTNYLVEQDGAVSLGAGGTGASVRLFLSDTASAIDIGGAVTLGGTSSISVAGGDADSFATISSVIGDGGSGYGLAINDDAGGWAQTNTILRLTGLNTFTGNVSIAQGTLQFDTVTNAAGAASSLGRGSALSLGGSTLSFIGASNQSTNRAVDVTASSTLAANGTSGATINYSGAFTATGTDLSLTLSGSGDGIISGSFTPTTGTGDIVKSGTGKWTITSGANSTDDISINDGTLELSGTVGTVADDTIVTGATAVLNLNSTGVLNGSSATSSGLYARGGGTINLNANEAYSSATGLDFIFLGDTTGPLVPTLNTNTFTITTPRFDLGGRSTGLDALVNGTGTVTVTADFNLYRGTVNAKLAGAGPVEKFGPGTVTLKGDNSGLTSTTAVRVDEGVLALDYTADNATVKLRAATGIDARGGTLQLVGNNSAATTATVGSLTLGNSGSSIIQVVPGAGQQAVLNLNAITRANNAQDGTIRFILPSGTQSATNGITTDTLNTNGLLGLSGYATVNDGTGTWFARNATNAADGNIVALVSTAKNAVSTWLAGDHITDETTGFTGLVDCININSLRFNAAGGSDVNVSANGVLKIVTGGILVTDQVTSGTPGIFGGTLDSGVTELIITQDSSTTFEISSVIASTNALTKAGTGTLLLSGNNNYTDETEIQAGTLQVTGGNAIGDTSLVTLAANRSSTLQLLANETIGRLQGGQRNDGSDFGTVAIGANTLTINQSANTTYAGRFTGSGTIVLNVGSVGNLNYGGQSSTGLFSGSVIVNGGLFQISGAAARLGDATSFTINGAGNFLLDNNDDNSPNDRISDTATFTLNSAAGPFGGTTQVRGLAIRSDNNGSEPETIGNLTFASGANYASLESSGGTNAQVAIIASDWIRQNNATVNVRGRNLGATADASGRSQFKIADANDTAITAANIGGGGVVGGTAKNVSIIPWVIGETLTAGLADANMGNTFLSYVDNRGFVPLSLTNEFATFGTAAAGDNVRESLGADLTGLAGTTVNSLVINNTAFAGLDVTGNGAGQTLAVTSGAMLFTVTGGADSTAYDTTLGGFDSGITVGGTNEYVIHVVNPSSAATTATLKATIDSPLTSSADITKSGRGTLVLTQANTAGGGANKTTINEGALEIGNLGNIGGSTGNLVFAGGTLRLGTGFTDDFTQRTITLLTGGGTIDTNGIVLPVANSLGSGVGGLSIIGGGTIVSSGVSSYTGTTTLANGRLVLNGGMSNRLSASTGLVLGGGTTSGILQLGDSVGGASDLVVSSLATSGTGTTNAIVGGGGTASILTVNQSGISIFAGSIGGAGTNENQLSLIKSGAGSLTLSGAVISYTGPTTVNAGTLSITGSSAAALTTSGLTVAAGATLNVVNGAGQTIDLGGGVLNLGAGVGTTFLGLELGSTSAYDHVVTTAPATTANAVRFNLTGLSGFGAGTYDLLSAASGLNNATYSIGSITNLNGLTLSLTVDPTFVRLTSAASTGDFYWRGAIGTSWADFCELETNWTTDLAGTLNANGTPGAASSVIFSAQSAVGPTFSTTLDGAFTINDLEFASSPSGVTSVAIAAGTGGSLTLTPSLTTEGIKVADNAGAATISAPLVLGADQTWNVVGTGANGSSLGVSGGITGTANLTKTGNGTLTLSGTNTYVGSTTVSAGVLQSGATGAFNPTSAHVVSAGAILRLNNFDNTIGSLAGAGTVENGGSANKTLTLGGDNTNTTFSGVLQNGGAFTLGITKTGTGTQTLSGTMNTFTGATTVNQGTLAITGTISTGASNLTVGNNAAGSRGRFTTATGSSVTVNRINVGTNATAAGVVHQNGGTVIATEGDGNNLGIALGAAAGGYGYYKISDGTLTASRLTLGGNALANATGVFEQTGGSTTITTWVVPAQSGGVNALLDVSGGTFNAGANFAMAHGSSNYAVTNVRGTGVLNRVSGTTAAFSVLNNNTSNANNIAIFNLLTGGTYQANSGGISLVNPASGTGNLGQINFNGGTLLTNAASTSLVAVTSTGLSAGSGAFLHSGGLTVDTNNFNSTVTAALLAPTGEGVASIAVTDGGAGYLAPPVIKITGGSGAGATAVANMVDDGSGNGTFKIDSITITNPGTGYVNTDVLSVAFANNTSLYTTQATLGALAFNGGNVSGALTKTGLGTLTLTAANTYTGGSIVNQGVLALGVANALADTGNVTVNGGTFDVATFSDTVGTVTLQSGSITGTTGVLTATGAYALQSGSASAILAGSVGANKTTAGTVTLSGANTFSGAVGVTEGTLTFSASNNLGNGSATNTITVNGGTLSYAGSGSVDLGVTRGVLAVGSGDATFNVSNSTGVLTLSGGLAGASGGDLFKTGAGSVVVTGPVNLNGGAVTVSDGRLSAGFSGTGTSSVTVAGTGVLHLVDSLTTTLALGGGSLNLASGARLGFELGASGVSDKITLAGAASVAGTITLDFFNVGLTAGTYMLLEAGSGLDAASYVLGNAPTGFNYTINVTGTLVSLDTTVLISRYWKGLAGDGSWNTVNAGANYNWSTLADGSDDLASVPGVGHTVIFSASNASGPAITTSLDAAFDIDSLQFLNVPATVTSVDINPGVGGSLTLSPASSTNGIFVAANGGNIVIAAPVTTGAAQTWNVNGTGLSSLNVSGNVTFTSALSKSGAGALTLSGSNSGAGGINLLGGTLNINSPTALGTGIFSIGAGTVINNTTAGAITLSPGPSAVNVNGSFVFTGTQSLDLGAANVSLNSNSTITTSANTLTMEGNVSDGSGAFNLTKEGAGTLTILGLANEIGGTLAVSAGGFNMNNGTSSLGAVAVSGGTVSINCNATVAGAVSITGGTTTMNGTNTLSGGVSSTAGSLTLGGANTITGAVTNMGGSVTLGGANSISAGVIQTSGTLNINHASALGSQPFSINGGTIDNTSGSAVTSTTNNAMSWNGSFTFTGGSSLDLGTGNVSLGNSLTVTTNANTLTVGGVIDDGADTFNLTKAGTGTLLLGGLNTYSGLTNINAGTVQLGVSNALPTGTVVQLGTGSTAGSLDLNGFDQTIGSLTVQSTSNAVTNNIIVDTGKTLTINGAVTLGIDANASDTNINASGGGSIVVNSGGANFIVGAATGATNDSRVDADFSGLSNFTANLGSGIFRLGDVNSGTETNPSTFKLAVNNSITASTIRVGDGAGGSFNHTLTLGSGSNTFNANTFNVGSAGGNIRSGGVVLFDGADTTGTLTLRASDGSSRTALNMVNTTGNTGGAIDATMNLAGHTADLLVSTLAMAVRSVGTGAGSATLTFDQGTLNITTLTMAQRTGTGGNATATVNLGDSVAAGTPTTTIGTLNMAVNTSSGGTVIADLNVTGGNVTIGTGTGTAINMANAGTGRTVTSTIDLTGGTVSVNGNIVRTGGAGTENATVTLAGASLDMNSKSIGTGSANIALAAQSGTLTNLAELNGGGVLTKTTVGTLTLGNGNTYTGGTAVNGGTLLANNSTGSATGTGTVTVTGGTLGGNGRVTGNTSINAGGILAAGSAASTAGTLTLAGSLTMAGSGSPETRLSFDFTNATGNVGQSVLDSGSGWWASYNGTLLSGNGTQANDLINLTATTGSPTLTWNAGGKVTLNQLGTTYNWVLGDVLNLLDWTNAYNGGGAISGTFNPATDFDLPTLAGGLTWDTTRFLSKGALAVTPEPSRALLLMLGLLGLFFRRRRSC